MRCTAGSVMRATMASAKRSAKSTLKGRPKNCLTFSESGSVMPRALWRLADVLVGFDKGGFAVLPGGSLLSAREDG